MKKAIICALITGMLTASAYAQEVKTDIDLTTRDITISGLFEKSVVNNMISLEVVSVDDDSVVPYIGTFAPKNDGSYSFKFRMPETAETGYYKIILGVYGQDETVEEIYYAKKADINALLEAINTAGSYTDIRSAVDGSISVLNIPKDAYEALDSKGKDAVAKTLFENRQYTDLADAKADAYSELAVQAFRCADNKDDIKNALEEYNDVYNITAETSRCYDLIEKFGSGSELDKKLGDAYKIMADSECDSIESLIDVYDKALIIVAINNAEDPNEIKSILDNDIYRDVMGFDMATYDKSNKEKTAKHIYSIDEDFENIDEIEDAIKDAYKDQNKASSNKNTGGGGGGGSSSGGITNYAPATAVVDNNKTEEADKEENKEETNVSEFADLSDAEWAREAIIYLSDKKIVAGMEIDGKNIFNPNGQVTREQFTIMLVNAFGLGVDGAECSFADIPAEHWAYNAVASAYQKGIVSGVSENEFGTGKNITRQDMAVMVYKASTAAGYEFTAGDIDFIDVDDISSYAIASVAAMNNNGIINGYPDGSFGPKKTATRAQAAQIIYTIIK